METVTKTCWCTGLLITVRKPINDFKYICVACGRMWQKQVVEIEIPKRTYLTRATP